MANIDELLKKQESRIQKLEKKKVVKRTSKRRMSRTGPVRPWQEFLPGYTGEEEAEAQQTVAVEPTVENVAPVTVEPEIQEVEAAPKKETPKKAAKPKVKAEAKAKAKVKAKVKAKAKPKKVAAKIQEVPAPAVVAAPIEEKIEVAAAPVVQETVEPVVEPQMVEPQMVEPQMVEPQMVEPQMVEPQIAEPQIVEPHEVSEEQDEEDSEEQLDMVGKKLSNLEELHIEKPAPKVKQISRGPLWLDQKERGALLRATERGIVTRDIAIVKMLLNTGLTVRDVCNLSWKDVNFTPGRTSVTSRSADGTAQREIPLNSEAKEAIMSMNPGRNTSPDQRVFDQRGSCLTPGRVQRILNQYTHKAGLRDIMTDNLRHTFCKNLLDAGANFREVAMLTGHESPSAVQNYCAPYVSA